MMNKIDIGADTYYTKRVSVRGHWREYVWERRPNGQLRIKTHVKWIKNWRKKVSERLVVYRSSYTLSYPTSARNGATEYRVWVYTNKPDIAIEDLETKIEELQEAFPSKVKFQEYSEESNELISKDEMEPINCSLNLWKGRALFNREGKVSKYEADLGYR